MAQHGFFCEIALSRTLLTLKSFSICSLRVRVANKPLNRPSIVDVARDAGVSPATVSRAFNQPGLLRPETLRRITQVARAKGFRPNRLGSSLRSGSTRTVGVVLPALSEPVFALCLEGAERHAREQGYSIRVAAAGHAVAGETAAVRSLVEHQVDGVLLAAANAARSTAPGWLAEQGVPYVLACNESSSHPCVAIDNAAAAGDMVGLLAENGHRRIAVVTGPLRISEHARRRLQGARARVRKLGLPEPAHVQMRSHDIADADVLAALLQQAAAPTALFCSSDLLAVSVIAALAAAGLSVPRDMSVCGFGAMDFAAAMRPALTTVQQSCRDIGARACESLLAQLRGEAAGRLLLPHRIVGGHTVASLADAACSPPRMAPGLAPGAARVQGGRPVNTDA